MFRILKKLERYYYSWINKKIFSKVNCSISEICIGPEVQKDFDIKHPQNLSIGKGTALNGALTINALGGVSIGCSCHIAKGFTVYSHNHNFKSEEYIPYDSINLLRPVEIGDAVWIGTNVTIAPGSKIGHGVIISSGSVVFGDVPDCAIIRGNPAEVIKFRDEEVFWKLYQERKFA